MYLYQTLDGINQASGTKYFISAIYYFTSTIDGYNLVSRDPSRSPSLDLLMRHLSLFFLALPGIHMVSYFIHSASSVVLVYD